MFNIDLLNKFRSLNTPFYYYDLDILKENLNSLKTSLNDKNKVHFALKSNFNSKILGVIKSYGLGIDAVSGNEIKKAIEVGFKPKDIVFAGVGKTDSEIKLSIDNNISYLNCESPQEIDVINNFSSKVDKVTKISIRINPNIKTDTHKNIQTGHKSNKFGIDLNDLNEIIDHAKKLNNIEVIGFHFHLGSQISQNSPFLKLCDVANDVNNLFKNKSIDIKYINVGGGLAIDYKNPVDNRISNFQNFINIFNKNVFLNDRQILHFELGRSIVGQCGFLITKILFTKRSYNKSFIIVDAGMNDLVRPALYDSYHKIINISSIESEVINYDVVGPICESSDTFVNDYSLPLSKRGDFIVICSAGAYGESMSSNYNLRNKLKSYYSDTI
tara:strand:- start:5756 stop:6910 length:1155 start_codon:yes stop_codon:yes gene_type:complete